MGDSSDDDYGQIVQFASSAGEGGRMRFIAGTTETMNLRGGNVGIGTTSPSAPLHVVGKVMAGNVLTTHGHANADDLILGDISNSATGMTIVSTDSGNIHFGDGTSSGNANIQGQLVYAHNDNSFRFYTAVTEKLRITSDGNIGIGDTSPFAKLHVENTGWSSGSPYGTVAYIQGGATNDANWGHLLISQSGTTTDTGGRLAFGANGENPIAGIRAKYKGATYGDLAFSTRPSGGTNTERMVINSYGKVEWYTQANSNSKKVEIHNGEGLFVYNNGGSSSYGLGSSLRVADLSYNQTATHYIEIGGSLPGYSAGQYNCLATNLNDLHFAAGGVYTGYISYNSGFIDVSDEREKENIVTISNATTKLKQLRGVYHTWKDTENRGTDTQMGLIAQEVEAVVPEVVTTSNPTSLNTPESDNAGLKGVAYSKLVPLLIETIKELEARIETLEG